MLSSVWVFYPPQSTEQVIGALTEKYGKPTRVDSSTVQNRMGAAFEQNSTRWVRRDGTIVARRYAASLDHGLAILFGLDEYRRATATADPKKSSKDL